jgi:hypothetical protein
MVKSSSPPYMSAFGVRGNNRRAGWSLAPLTMSLGGPSLGSEAGRAVSFFASTTGGNTAVRLWLFSLPPSPMMSVSMVCAGARDPRNTKQAAVRRAPGQKERLAGKEGMEFRQSGNESTSIKT